MRLAAAASVAAVLFLAAAACGPAGQPGRGEPAGSSPGPSSPPAIDARATAPPSPAVERLGLESSAPDAVAKYRAPRDVDAVAEPTAVRIPGIGVDSPLDRLGHSPDGTVEVPADYQRAGWYAEGARPGQQATAVLLGHVDSRAGPAVFYRVASLEPGDEVLVDREDGSTATFVVDRVEQHDKEQFPTEAVYFPTLEPALALVTCGGRFDPTAGRYRDNVIAFATLRE